MSPAPGPALDGELLARVRERLSATATDPADTRQVGDIRPGTIADAIRAEAKGVLADADILRALKLLEAELVGAGPLEPLLGHPHVSDVLVVGPDRVWADRGLGLELTDVRFPDDDSVRRLAQRLALHAGRRLDLAQPWVDGWLAPGALMSAGALASPGASASAGGGPAAPAGVRLHAILPPLSSEGTCVSLRVLRPARHTLAELGRLGAVPADLLGLLSAIVRARLAFLVVGGTGSGKTTLLAAMLGAVDPAERVICVEDAAELAPHHPHVVRLVARTANIEGAGAVGVRDLVRQALRMRPDRIVVGEVRGPEVVDLLGALNTGHDGGAGTVHANTPAEVPARLEALAAMGGMGRAALHSQLAAAVHVVLHVARHHDGTRALCAVSLLARTPAGLVEAVPAWTSDAGHGPGWAQLRQLLRQRGQDPE